MPMRVAAWTTSSGDRPALPWLGQRSRPPESGFSDRRRSRSAGTTADGPRLDGACQVLLDVLAPKEASMHRFIEPICRCRRGSAGFVRASLAKGVVPLVRIERTTFRLQGGCSTN